MKTQRAQRRKVCDGCKRRKVRCDGEEGAQIPCTSCRTFHIPCTYIGVTRPKQPPKDYVQLLETKLDQMAALIAQHIPTDQLPADYKYMTPYNNMGHREPSIRPFLQDEVEPWKSTIYRKELGRFSSTDDSDDYQESEINNGSSDNALPLKEELTPDTYSSLENFAYTPNDPEWIDHFRRMDAVRLAMPSPDVASPFFTSFFSYVTPFLPVVDQTTFLEQYTQASESHMYHPSFTVLVRLVCAIGAFHQSNVLTAPASGKYHTVPGYEFFRDTKDAMNFGIPSLVDLQCRTLAGLYYHLLGDTHASWIELSVGIRLGQSVGAHRKPPNKSALQPQDDWIKVFWCLIHLDRHTSRELGRLPMMRITDFDLPPPKELRPETEENDMNYFSFLIWTDRLFAVTQTQASVAPNRGSFFYLQISPHSTVGFVSETQEGVVKLLASLPERWRWDPGCPDLIRLAQTAQLFCTIHYIDILFHRLRFNDADATDPNLNLDFSANAAQSVSHMVVVCARRRARMLPHAYSVVFASAVVLLTAIWVKRNQTPNQDVQTLIDGVGRCIETLRLTETWLAAAGRYVDVLRHLASFGDIAINLEDNNASVTPSAIPMLLDQQDSSMKPAGTSESVDPSTAFFRAQLESPFVASYSNHSVPLLEDWFSQPQSNTMPPFWNEWSGYLSTLDIIEAPMNYEPL